MRQEVAQEQVRGRLGAHVHVVAHLHPLGGECEEVVRPRLLHDRAQQGPGDLAQEDQRLDRCRAVAAEPRGLPGALVDRREGPRATGAVDDLEERGRGSDGAGHREYDIVLVGRFQPDLAGCQHPVRLGDVAGPAFGDGRRVK